MIMYFSSRKVNIKSLNKLILDCSNNELNYKQFCRMIKNDENLKLSLKKIIEDAKMVETPSELVYKLKLINAPSDNKLNIIQCLTSCGLSAPEAELAINNVPSIAFRNLTEDQALKLSATLEHYGVKIEILNDAIYTPENIEQTKKINKNFSILQAIRNFSYLSLFVLFVLPLVNINALITSYDVGIFSFIFSNKNSCDGILAFIMSDFIGIETSSFKNVFSLLENLNLNNLLSFMSIAVILIATLITSFLSLMYLISILAELFTNNSKKINNSAVNHNYKVKLKTLTNKQIKYKNNKTVFLFLKYLISKTIRIFFVSFFPFRLIAFLSKDPLISVSPAFLALSIIILIINFSLSIICWFYSVKFAVELKNVSYLKKVIK